MNLLPVQVVAAGQLQLGQRRFAVEGPLADQLASRIGQQLWGGLRAEHLRLAPATNRNLAAELVQIEALGNEQLLSCRLAETGHLVQVRSGPEYRLVVGETIYLELDPRGWRLFDSSGQALVRPIEAANRQPQLPAL